LTSVLGAAAVSGILLPITTGLTAQWLYNIAWFNPPRDALFTGCVVLVMTAPCGGVRTFQRENA
jgi:hypothetical protein